MTTSTTKRPEKNKILRYFSVSLIWLAIWEGLSIFIDEELIFASPFSVLVCIADMAVTAEYWQIIFSSVLRIVGGFLLGFAIAFILAFVSYKSEFFKALVFPMISVIKSTPVASFIILALMWIGKDFVPLIIGTLMVMPIVWSNVLEGLSDVDNSLLEMSQVYKLSTFKRLKAIYIPSLIPFCTAAVSSGLGLCWKAGVAAEVICRTLPSIGNSIWETKFYLKTDEMFAWTLTVIILSVAFDFLADLISKPVLKRYGQTEEIKDLDKGDKQETDKEETSSFQIYAEKFNPTADKVTDGIAMRNVSFSYGESAVLKDLNLDIPGKGITVVSAPSGAGKTTLLRIISGLNKPESGEVSGVPKRISYVFQEQRLLPWATALENIMIVGRGAAKAQNSDGTVAQNLLSELGISQELAHKLPYALSGGERQRACVARALFFDGDVLLLDEPFTGLDKENRERALALIRLYAKDRPVILVSHLVEDLKEADTVIEL